MHHRVSSLNLARGERSSYRAFTLIELLVVIAIIAILAAILFPVFARARENARRASCQSNLKQLGLGVLQYAQDYDEYYMPVYTNAGTGTLPNQASPPTRSWVEFVYPYTKSLEILRCPSDSAAQGTPYAIREWRTRMGWPTTQAIPINYSYSLYLGGGTGYTGNVGDFQKLSALQAPSKVIMMSDSGATPPWKDTPARPASTPPEQWTQKLATDSVTPSLKHGSYVLLHPNTGITTAWTNANYGTIYARHFNTSNILWADGHVKAQRPEQIMNVTDIPSEFTNTLNSCFNPAVGCNGS
ncbi:DUF1559 domain-containing protein [bacterium]|nr:MAG: DUF1559 domain-containing protein [bacterium]